jgi:hypothetical protein
VDMSSDPTAAGLFDPAWRQRIAQRGHRALGNKAGAAYGSVQDGRQLLLRATHRSGRTRQSMAISGDVQSGQTWRR